MIRGFLGRRRAIHIFHAIKRRKAALYVNGIIQEAIEIEAKRVFALRLQMSVKIQRVYRGHLVRLILDQARKTAMTQLLMAMRIQVRYI